MSANPEMQLFIDTNIFVAALTDEPGRGDVATALLDSDHELYTSLLNLMELRTVLAKKKQQDAAVVTKTLGDIAVSTGILIPDAGDIMAANNYQNQTLVYPMDAIITTVALRNDLELVTFDSELLEHDAVEPSDIL